MDETQKKLHSPGFLGNESPVQTLSLVPSREQQLSFQACTLPSLPIPGYKSWTDFHRGSIGATVGTHSLLGDLNSLLICHLRKHRV